MAAARGAVEVEEVESEALTDTDYERYAKNVKNNNGSGQDILGPKLVVSTLALRVVGGPWVWVVPVHHQWLKDTVLGAEWAEAADTHNDAPGAKVICICQPNQKTANKRASTSRSSLRAQGCGGERMVKMPLEADKRMLLQQQQKQQLQEREPNVSGGYSSAAIMLQNVAIKQTGNKGMTGRCN
uniref:HDC05451 n=1 Tax=Drosophila melanogaster TaxID=7227 RepID=Q6IGS5_DROME|nr:TPA_inf: HDC05451 [Drosophila melanogaster]